MSMALFAQLRNPSERRPSSISTNLHPFQEDLSPSPAAQPPVNRSRQSKSYLVAGPSVHASVAAYLRSWCPDWDLSKYINDDLPHPYPILGVADAMENELHSKAHFNICTTISQAPQTNHIPPSSRTSFAPSRPRSRVLALPTEVRLIVLTHLLISPIPINNPAKPRYPNTVTRISGSILATCRRIYAEGWPLLYHHNLFRFDLLDAYRFWILPRAWNIKHCDIHHLDLNLEIATQSFMQRPVHNWPGATFRWVKVNPMEEWKDVFAPWRHTELRTLKLTLRGYGLLSTGVRNNLARDTIKQNILNHIRRGVTAPHLHDVDIKSTGGAPQADRQDNALAKLSVYLLESHIIRQLGKALRSSSAEQKYLLYRAGGLIETLTPVERRGWDFMKGNGYCEGRRREMLIMLQIKEGLSMRSGTWLTLGLGSKDN